MIGADHLTLGEAAAQCGLSPDTLRKQIHNGRLVAVKHGRDWFVSPADLRAYLRSRRRSGRRSPNERRAA